MRGATDFDVARAETEPATTVALAGLGVLAFTVWRRRQAARQLAEVRVTVRL